MLLLRGINMCNKPVLFCVMCGGKPLIPLYTLWVQALELATTLNEISTKYGKPATYSVSAVTEYEL